MLRHHAKIWNGCTVQASEFPEFDAALATPQVVDKRLAYMTPEWKDAFRFATPLTDSLHLEIAIAGSPRWSESGGPWVKPGEGMKKYCKWCYQSEFAFAVK